MRPAVRIVKTRNQTQQGAFARARHPENADDLPRLRLERNVRQHRFVRVITERHFFKHHPAREPRRLDGVRPALHFHRRVHHLEHAPRRRQTLLHRVRDGRDVRHLSGELLEQSREHHQPAAQRNFPLHIQPAAVREQNHQAQLRQHLRARREHRQIPENFPLLRRHQIVRLLKPPDLVRFRGETLSPSASRARFR